MIEKKPIICPKCKEVVIDDEKCLQHYVMYEDIKCLKCGEIVVFAPPKVLL